MLITGQGNILFAQMLARRSAVRLETLGMTRRGRSATQICREAYGIRARTKRDVLIDMEILVKRAKVAATIADYVAELGR